MTDSSYSAVETVDYKATMLSKYDFKVKKKTQTHTLVSIHCGSINLPVARTSSVQFLAKLPLLRAWANVQAFQVAGQPSTTGFTVIA